MPPHSLTTLMPVFLNSFVVNSANSGPYGDAIVTEFIPALEKEYRGIGEGWARGLFGGSTGGWESLAAQVFYPDEFNGAFVSCPDPITFSSYSTTNIYNDKNAYIYNSAFKQTEKPGVRDWYDGTTVGYGRSYDVVTASLREMNYKELVLGEKSRSCGQFDVWEATFGPMAKDGYPARIWDKKSGVIDAKIAEYWKENYDLLEIMRKNWKSLGPKLQGKLHIYVGNMDTFFLNNAVMDMKLFLESTENPLSDAEVVIGVHQGIGFQHCFSGYQIDEHGNALPNSITRLTNIQRFVPQFAKKFKNQSNKSQLEWTAY
jgi:hypothetical protein